MILLLLLLKILITVVLFIALVNLNQLIYYKVLYISSTYLKNIVSLLNVKFLVYSRQFFFLTFCFAIYKMVDSQYSMDIYKSVEIGIGTVMRNPEKVC